MKTNTEMIKNKSSFAKWIISNLEDGYYVKPVMDIFGLRKLSFPEVATRILAIAEYSPELIDELENDEMDIKTFIDCFLTVNEGGEPEDDEHVFYFSDVKHLLDVYGPAGDDKLIDELSSYKNKFVNQDGEVVPDEKFIKEARILAETNPLAYINGKSTSELIEYIASTNDYTQNQGEVGIDFAKLKEEIRRNVLRQLTTDSEDGTFVKVDSSTPRWATPKEITEFIVNDLNNDEISEYARDETGIDAFINRDVSYKGQEGWPFMWFPTVGDALEGIPNSGFHELEAKIDGLFNKNDVYNFEGEKIAVNDFKDSSYLWTTILNNATKVLEGKDLDSVLSECIADFNYNVIEKSNNKIKQEIHDKVLASLESEDGVFVKITSEKPHFVKPEEIANYIMDALENSEVLEYQQEATGIDAFINRNVSFDEEDNYPFMWFEDTTVALDEAPGSGVHTLENMFIQILDKNKLVNRYGEEVGKDELWEKLWDYILEDADAVLEGKGLDDLLNQCIEDNFYVKPLDKDTAFSKEKVQNDLEKLMGNFYDEEAQKHPYNTVVGSPEFDELAKQRAFSNLDVSDFANEIYTSIDANTDLNKFISQETILKQVATKNYDVSVKEIFNELIDKGQSVMLDKLAEEVGSQKASELAITTSELDKVKAYFGKFEYQKLLEE